MHISQLRHYLYDEVLPKYKQREYDIWVQITLFLIVEVEAMETFRCRKPVYALEGILLRQVAERDAISLRHPRLIRFRADKTATVEDIGYERQLLEEILCLNSLHFTALIPEKRA